MKSIIHLKCIKGDQEKMVLLTIESKDEVDETGNIIEAIHELRNTEHYDRVKYMKKVAA